MSMMGTEAAPAFGLIEPDSQRPPIEGRFTVQPLSGDRFQIRHPFHGPRTFGDGSVFSDKHIDTAAALFLDTLPYLVDSRKLNRTGRFETRPYAGEYPQASHCVSLGIMGAEFGGGPMDLFNALYNDAPHIYDGHQGDDNYQGHGKEDLHDYTRSDFYTRAGLITRFLEEGVLRPNGHGYHFGNTRLYIGTLLDENEVTVLNSFLSNKHVSRRMDADRFQYNEEELLLTNMFRHRNDKNPTRVPLALASAALEAAQRLVVVEDGEGDQLVFNNDQVGEMSARAYATHNALHWCEPVQDLVNDLLNLAERYFFVCDDDYARDYQYFYPRDYLHTSATLMFEHFDSVATRDPFMKWILDTAENIAKDQRSKMADIIDGKSEYSGPDPIDGVTLERLPYERVNQTFVVKDGSLEIVLPKGKMRTMDPRITVSKHETKPLSEIKPGLQDEINHLFSWIGNYTALIQLRNPEVEAMVRKGLEMVEANWSLALRRSRLPESDFKANIRVANDYVRKNGVIAH